MFVALARVEIRDEITLSIEPGEISEPGLSGLSLQELKWGPDISPIVSLLTAEPFNVK